MLDKTVVFSLENEVNQEIRKTMVRVYKALDEKGYNPVNQIVGYILSEDPTYITTFKNARNLISKIDRDELLRLLVKKFLSC
ncbi:MAG: IreB family regulatory phosphoprotein [Oscillospiraceae bacterium]|nr:IreB family regulatory phosphoprotein [Oscillospiraceae bacterium]